MESADAEYSPVIMSVPAGPEVPMQTPMLPARGAGVALGHVRGALDVPGQHVVDARRAPRMRRSRTG